LHEELTMGAVAEREVTASEDRGALAKMVMTLLDHWKLSTEDQAALLGIAPSNRAALSNYRSGKPIGTSRDQYERVGTCWASTRTCACCSRRTATWPTAG